MAPNGKPLTGKQAFGTEQSRQERIIVLSYERLNSIYARLNSTMACECRIYFFILVRNVFLSMTLKNSKKLCTINLRNYVLLLYEVFDNELNITF